MAVDLFGGLPTLGDTIVQGVTLIALCSVRIYVVMSIFPPTGNAVLQGVTRNGMAVLWSTFVAYGQQGLPPRLHGVYLLEVGVKEAFIGLMLGFAASTVFWVAEGAGVYVDDLTGYNNIQISNPSRSEQTTLTSTLLSQTVIAVFWMLGGMMFLLGAIYESYRWWPLDSVTPVAANVIEAFVLNRTDTLMQSIAKVAAPLLLVLLMVDLGLGFVTNVAEKLELSQLAQPIKGALNVFMLALLLGVFIDALHVQISLSGFLDELRALHGAGG
jgi:type III secretion protein T